MSNNVREIAVSDDFRIANLLINAKAGTLPWSKTNEDLVIRTGKPNKNVDEIIFKIPLSKVPVEDIAALDSSKY